MTTAIADDVCRRARAAASAGRWRDAAALVAPLVRPDAASAVLLFAAEIALRFGAYAEARDLARRAADPPTGPLDDRGLLHGARVLRRLELPESLERLLAAHSADIADNAVMAELAVLASSASLFAQAGVLARRLLGGAPRSPDAHYVAGLLAMFDGDRDRSLAHLDEALRLEPRMGNAHWLVAMQAGPSDAATHVDAMRRALPGIRPGSEAEAYVRYSLHRRLHALARYDEAWAELEQGIATARRLEPYDGEADGRLFEALRAAPVPSALPREPASPVRMIFIIGMFRSGTSLIERVLTGHPDVADGGETYQFTAALREAADQDGQGAIDPALLALTPRIDLRRVRDRMQAYASWRAGGKPCLTEKLPSNHLLVPWILAALPDAMVVHLRRDPVDTCFSNLRTYFRGAAPYSNSLVDVATYFRRYRELMAHWHGIAPGRIVDVDYADFVADPDQVSRRLLDACGLSYSPQVLDLASSPGRTTTASAAEMRQGILRDRHRAWLPYRERLRPMIDALGDAAAR